MLLWILFYLLVIAFSLGLAYLIGYFFWHWLFPRDSDPGGRMEPPTIVTTGHGPPRVPGLPDVRRKKRGH